MFYSQSQPQFKDTSITGSPAPANERCEYDPDEKMDDEYAQYVDRLLSSNSHDFSMGNGAEVKQDDQGKL